MVDLTQTGLATAEDRLYHIDYWALLFKAATWEKIRVLAQKGSELSMQKAELERLRAMLAQYEK